MKFKPFRAWMLYDRLGTYEPTIHTHKDGAQFDMDSQCHLVDAKWSIVRVEVRLPTTASKR